MRDRLIELIENAHWNWVKDALDKKKINLCVSKSLNETIADALLADGWIRPPVKVGDVVWHLMTHYDGQKEIRKGKVSMLQQKADKSWKIRITVNSSVWDFTPNEIGTLYFLTREEAEKALKGGKDINVLCKTEKGGEQG